jgi:hypothetical protein
MPPRFYLALAAGLAALVALSASLTSGSSIFVWQWLFAASGCVLCVIGVFRAVDALGAPRWIAAALSLPALLWPMNIVKSLGYSLATGLGNYEPAGLVDLIMIYGSVQIASLAAAAGALGLIETISKPHAWLRFGYAILAACAIVVCVGLTADVSGWSFARTAPYAASTRAWRIAATLVEYSALIGVAVLLTKRRGIEPWAAVVLSLIGCILLYNNLRFILGAQVHTMPSFWSQPFIMFIGGAAVWRIGSVLSLQAAPVQTSEVVGHPDSAR